VADKPIFKLLLEVY